MGRFGDKAGCAAPVRVKNARALAFSYAKEERRIAGAPFYQLVDQAYVKLCLCQAVKRIEWKGRDVCETLCNEHGAMTLEALNLRVDPVFGERQIRPDSMDNRRAG